MQSIFFAVSVAVLLLITVYPVMTAPWISDGYCKQCPIPEECNLDVNCIYGHIIDKCKRKVCKKGPDEKCGHAIQECGDGMFCNNCDVCGGCSLVTLKCSKTECTKLRRF